MAGGRNYAHYFLPLTPSLSLLGGLAYWRLADTLGDAPAARRDIEAIEDRAAADAVTHITDLNNGIAGLRRRSLDLNRRSLAQAACAS